jgi:hypothetical protein
MSLRQLHRRELEEEGQEDEKKRSILKKRTRTTTEMAAPEEEERAVPRGQPQRAFYSVEDACRRKLRQLLTPPSDNVSSSAGWSQQQGGEDLLPAAPLPNFPGPPSTPSSLSTLRPKGAQAKISRTAVSTYLEVLHDLYRMEAPPPPPLLLDRNDRHLVFYKDRGGGEERRTQLAYTPQELLEKDLFVEDTTHRPLAQVENVPSELWQYDDSLQAYQQTNVVERFRDKIMLEHHEMAKRLYGLYFETSQDVDRYRHWHRPRLNLPGAVEGSLSKWGRFPRLGTHPADVYVPTFKNIGKISSELSSAHPISGNRLFVVEYLEERPMLLTSIGMASRLTTYWCFKNGLWAPRSSSLGDVKTLQPQDQSPFISRLSPGEAVQALENKLFIAPVAEHKVAPTDFLLVRNSSHNQKSYMQWWVKELPALYAVGQLQPKVVVSKPLRSPGFVKLFRNRIKAFLLREFEKDQRGRNRREYVPSIQLSAGDGHTVSDRFGEAAGQVARSILNNTESGGEKIAEFRRDQGRWHLIDTNRNIKALKNIDSICSPEDAVLLEASLAAQAWLEEKGLKNRSNPAAYGQEVKSFERRAAEQVKELINILYHSAWEQSEAYKKNREGQYNLDLEVGALAGDAAQLAYIPDLAKVKNALPTRNRDTNPKVWQGIKTGTDKDMRKLNMTQIRSYLEKMGARPSSLKEPRWKLTKRLTNLVSQAYNQGDPVPPELVRFVRDERRTTAEKRKRFSKELTSVFHKHLRALRKTREEYLARKPSAEKVRGKPTALAQDGEAPGRLQLGRTRPQGEGRPALGMAKERMSAGKEKDKPSKKTKKTKKIQVLKKWRIKVKKNGTEEKILQEVIKDPAKIAFFKRDGEAFRKAEEKANPNASQQRRSGGQSRKQKEKSKEMAKKIRRKLLAKHKAIEKEIADGQTNPSLNLRKRGRCANCKMYGHTKTNKNCPKYEEYNNLDNYKYLNAKDAGRIKETKNGNVLRLTNIHQIGKETRKREREKKKGSGKRTKTEKERAADQLEYLQYTKKVRRPTTRRKLRDPQVLLGSELEKVVQKLLKNPLYHVFSKPVDKKKYPDYFTKIQSPMDLTTMRKKANQHRYTSAKECAEDLKKIVTNSTTYNGPHAEITRMAAQLFDEGKAELNANPEIREINEELKRMRALQTLQGHLNRVIKEMKEKDESLQLGRPYFWNPVNVSQVPSYLQKIRRPMALVNLKKTCDDLKYTTPTSFWEDAKLISENARTFNGSQNDIPIRAAKVIETGRLALCKLFPSTDFGEQIPLSDKPLHSLPSHSFSTNCQSSASSGGRSPTPSPCPTPSTSASPSLLSTPASAPASMIDTSGFTPMLSGRVSEEVGPRFSRAPFTSPLERFMTPELPTPRLDSSGTSRLATPALPAGLPPSPQVSPLPLPQEDTKSQGELATQAPGDLLEAGVDQPTQLIVDDEFNQLGRDISGGGADGFLR